MNRLVPILFSYGNHDFGLNALPERGIPIGPSGPGAMMYFPMHLSTESEAPAVPLVTDRRSYHYHKLGKIVLFNLDSGYLADYNGKQLDFIREVSSQHPDYVKMASYHNPNYYTCKNGLANQDAIVAGLAYWNPVFDEFKFMAAFENHEHTFKKSFPIANEKYDPKGTYYLGNGNWGADLRDDCDLNNDTGALEIVEQKHHIFVVNISAEANMVTYNVFDENGVQFINPFSQNISDYTTQL